MDMEKVIKGLETCIPMKYETNEEKECRHEQCPYGRENYKPMNGCFWDLMSDALARLKEQEWHLITEDADGYLHGLLGDDGQYLMTDGKDIWIDDYVDGVDDGIWLDSGRDIREIKAWMYMPKLPILD